MREKTVKTMRDSKEGEGMGEAVEGVARRLKWTQGSDGGSVQRCRGWDNPLSVARLRECETLTRKGYLSPEVRDKPLLPTAQSDKGADRTREKDKKLGGHSWRKVMLAKKKLCKGEKKSTNGRYSAAIPGNKRKRLSVRARHSKRFFMKDKPEGTPDPAKSKYHP